MYVLSFGYTSERRRTQPISAWQLAVLALLLIGTLQVSKCGGTNDWDDHDATATRAENSFR